MLLFTVLRVIIILLIVCAYAQPAEPHHRPTFPNSHHSCTPPTFPLTFFAPLEEYSAPLEARSERLEVRIFFPTPAAIFYFCALVRSKRQDVAFYSFARNYYFAYCLRLRAACGAHHRPTFPNSHHSRTPSFLPLPSTLPEAYSAARG